MKSKITTPYFLKVNKDGTIDYNIPNKIVRYKDLDIKGKSSGYSWSWSYSTFLLPYEKYNWLRDNGYVFYMNPQGLSEFSSTDPRKYNCRFIQVSLNEDLSEPFILFVEYDNKNGIYELYRLTTYHPINKDVTIFGEKQLYNAHIEIPTIKYIIHTHIPTRKILIFDKFVDFSKYQEALLNKNTKKREEKEKAQNNIKPISFSLNSPIFKVISVVPTSTIDLKVGDKIQLKLPVFEFNKSYGKIIGTLQGSTEYSNYIKLYVNGEYKKKLTFPDVNRIFTYNFQLEQIS